MSVESMAIALHHSRAKGTARLILVGIANHDGDGGAWPSVKTLAKYAGGVDRTTVQAALRKLVALGEIDVQRQAGGTAETPDDLRPNLYHFTLTCPGDCDRTKHHRTSRQLRLERGPGRPRNRAVSAPPGGVGTARGGGVSTARGAVSAPPEPSYETNLGTAGLRTPTTETASGCGQPPHHDCEQGWLGEQPDGTRAPCLLCKPHLARRRRSA